MKPLYQELEEEMTQMFSKEEYIKCFPRPLQEEMRSIVPHIGTVSRAIIDVATLIAFKVVKRRERDQL